MEESNLIKLMEGQPKPAFFDLEVPYDLEQPGAHIESYHPTIPFDICDGIVDLLHHAYVYIIPIQVWI